MTLFLLITFLIPVSVIEVNDTQEIHWEKRKQVLTSKIRYYYNDALTDSAIMTTEAHEFEENLSMDEEIVVVFELSNRPPFCDGRLIVDRNVSHEETKAIRHMYYEKIKDYYAKVNTEFLTKNALLASSDDYTLFFGQYFLYA